MTFTQTSNKVELQTQHLKDFIIMKSRFNMKIHDSETKTVKSFV